MASFTRSFKIEMTSFQVVSAYAVVSKNLNVIFEGTKPGERAIVMNVSKSSHQRIRELLH